MDFNKIAAALLISGIIAMLSGIFADGLYQPVKKVATRGYEIAVSDHSSNDNKDGKSADQPMDIKSLMAQANAEAGKSVAKACLACHSFEKGASHKVGPALWGILGDKKARSSNFAYSKAMQEKGGNWNYDDMVAFLHKPKQFVPGTKMSYIGIKNPQDIANILAYMRTMSDNPPALP